MLSADSRTVSTLFRGTTSFRAHALLSTFPIEFPSYKLTPSNSFVSQQEVSEMVDKDALQIFDNTSPGFYSHFFLVKKGLGAGDR